MFFGKQILLKSVINGSLPPRSARGRLVPPRDDAKRQWGQSPEIEDWLRRMQSISTESMDDPTTPRYAMSGFYIEKGGFQYAAATDARHRAGQRRHDMAAGATRILMQYPQTINDNSWYINGNSCKTTN